MLKGLKKPWKQALAYVMATLMIFGVIPANPYSETGGILQVKAVSDGDAGDGTTYTLDPSTAIASVDKKGAIAAKTYGTDDYFTLSGTATRGNSDTYSFELKSEEGGAISFTVSNKAKVVVSATSTGGSNESRLMLKKDGTGVIPDGAEKAEVTVTGTSVTTVSYSDLEEGTYSVVSPTGFNARGVRITDIVVTEEAPALVTSTTIYKLDPSTAIAGIDKKGAIAAKAYGTSDYYTLSGTATRGNSDVYSFELKSEEGGAISFTVSGTANVEISATSTGGSNESRLMLKKDGTGVIPDGAEKAEVTVTGTSVTTVSYSDLEEGTYSVVSPTGFNARGVRITEIETEETTVSGAQVKFTPNIANLEGDLQVRLVKGSTQVALTNGAVATVAPATYDIKVYTSAAADATVLTDYAAVYDNASSIKIDEAMEGTTVAFEVISTNKNITVSIDEASKKLLDDRDAKLQYNKKDDTTKTDITFTDGKFSMPVELDAKYNITCTNSKLAVSADAAEFTVAADTTDVAVELTSKVMDVTIKTEGESLGSATLKLTSVNNSSEYVDNLTNGSIAKDIWFNNDYKVEVVGDDTLEAKFAKNGASAYKIVAADTTLTITLSKADVQPHIYDVWDFGAEQLKSTTFVTYNNMLTEADINGQYSGVAAGTANINIPVEGFDFGEVKYNPSKTGHRLRTTNVNLTRYDDKNKKDADGTVYTGYIYSNTGKTSDAYIAVTAQKGDKFIFVVGSNGGAATYNWANPDGVVEATAKYTAANQAEIVTFYASVDGEYRLYVTDEKLVVARILREHATNVTVSGTAVSVDNDSVDGATIQFTQKSIDTDVELAVYEATISGGKYSVELQEGFAYDLALSGKNGYIVESPLKVSYDRTSDGVAGSATATLDVQITPVDLVTFTGNLGELDATNAAKLTMEFTVPEGKVFVPEFTLDKKANTYTLRLEKGVEYGVKAVGVDEFVIDKDTVADTDASGSTLNMTFTKRPVYNVNVNVTGVTGKLKNLSLSFARLTDAISTTAEEGDQLDGYTYDYTGVDGIQLRDGQYQITAKLTGYTQGVTTDLVVNGADAIATIPMVSNKTESVAYSETVQVGADKPYQTINAALTAIKNMSDRNGRRVTIEIDPGTYEEMLYIDMPNISLKNAASAPSIGVSNEGKDIDANAVRITGYYGHGYSYYSMNDKYQWDADTLAANLANGYESVTNPGSGTATMWNSTVVITGDNFTADDIIFENSFNIYVSKKASEDKIVKLGSANEGSEARAEMEEGSIKVQEKAYVERAGALALANNLEGAVFNNCRFVGRQDVLYGGSGTFAEFNKCIVAGACDFIYGGMTAIFNSCEIVSNSTNAKNDITYITAPQQSSGRGYLFWNCTIRKALEGIEISTELGATANQALLGRLWQPVTGEAVFYNTKVMNGMVYTVGADEKRASTEATNQPVVANVGWASSWGESELCGEYNTVDESGNALNVSERASWSKQFTDKMITLEDGSKMEITPENWRKPVSTTVEWNDITYGSGVNASRYWRTGTVEDGSVQIKVGEFGNGVEFKNNGKWVPASYDGLSYYYTTVPSYKNFTLRAKVHVNEFWLSNGQEAFGLMANDKLGGDGWNNSYAAGVTKTEYYWDAENQTVTNDSTMKKVSQKFGVMAQEKKGITTFNYPLIKANDTETIQSDFSSTLYPLEQRYPNSGNVIGNVLNNGSDQNITDMYLTIQKNNTGYFLTYESVDGSYSVTKKYYDTAALNQLDPNKVYIGMFAARCADITFSDISFVITDPATDAPAEERPSEVITTVATISSATSSNKEAYDLYFNANADGKADLYVDDELVESGLEVEADTRLTIPMTLHWGNNRIKVVYDANDDFTPGEYQVMSEYGPIEIEQTVVFSAIDRDVIYSAPGGNGNGSKEDPMDLLWALKYVQPGGTIYMMEGTYKFSKTVTIPRGTDGSEDNKITLMADPEATSMPVIDGSKCSGIAMEVAGNYWVINGIAVTNSADGKDGMHVSGSHNLIENVSTYNNGNTGLQISRLASTDDRDMWPSYNTILNCTSYNNADKGYEDADGFAAKLTVGDGIVFDGCIAYNNADDGWDLFAKVQTGTIGSVTIQNCVAYANGYLRDGTNAGNGNGFKMGGDSLSGYHVLKNSVAFDNKAKGIDSNSCPDNEVYNCISFNNGSYNVALYTNNASKTDYVAQNVISYRSGSSVDTSENIKLVNQDQNQVFGDDCGNYFWKSPVMGGAKDASTTITDDWFERVDTYFDASAHTYSQSPVGRKADGTIDMMGLLILKDAKSEELGYMVDPGQGTISTNIQQYERKIVLIPSVSIADALTDEVMAATGAKTEEELKAYLNDRLDHCLGNANEPDRVLKVVDLKLVYMAEDGTFIPVTKDNFPSEGMDITITWDAMGFTGKSGDYEFCILHLIVNDWNNQVPGTLETVKYRRSEDGLVVHLMSCSPFAIGWVMDDDDDDDEDVKAGESAGDTIASIATGAMATGKTASKPGASPKTFDESRFVPEITETEVAEFAKKQVEKQLEQEAADLLITPQATRFPYGIIIAAVLALAAFIGGEVIYFRRKKNK